MHVLPTSKNQEEKNKINWEAQIFGLAARVQNVWSRHVERNKQEKRFEKCSINIKYREKSICMYNMYISLWVICCLTSKKMECPYSGVTRSIRLRNKRSKIVLATKQNRTKIKRFMWIYVYLFKRWKK